MGTQSSTHPYSLFRVLIWIALVVLPPLRTTAQTINATTVSLILPSAIVFDPSGNLYLAETGNHVVRKIDSQGHITTVVGTGTQGFSGDSGLAPLAQLDSPQGLALAGGTLYIADTHNHRIRAVDLVTNVINTVTGGTPGFDGDGGAAIKAHLNLPTALATDTSGNLYLADTANHRIRRIAIATGIITTVGGNGTQGYAGDNASAIDASIDSPSGIAVDPSGNLYLADTHNHRVRKIATATGIITTLAGTGLRGSGATQLALPQGITVDAAGGVYVADTANHRILRIDGVNGNFSIVAGTGTQGFSGDAGPASAATLDSPRTVMLTSTARLVLSDSHNQRVRQVTSQSIDTVAGLGDTGSGILTLSGSAVISYGTGQLTAALTSSTQATGKLTFFDNYRSVFTTLTAIPLASNSAAISTATLPVGVHVLSATYPGDLTHASAQSAAFSLNVKPASTLTTISLSSTAAQPITVAATVASGTSGVPTGTVTLLESGTAVGTAPLTASGGASAVLPTLGAGTYTLIASYSGDNNFEASASAPTAITIGLSSAPTADFTLTANAPVSQSIPAGSAATYSFTTQTQGALSSPITLTASGLPPGATATFSPTYLPPGNISNSFILTITTLKPAVKTQVAMVVGPTFLASFVFWALGIKRRSRGVGVLLTIACISWVVFSTTGCGDRISTAHSQATIQPVTYTLTVTGTATDPGGAVLVHSASVALTVQ